MPGYFSSTPTPIPKHTHTHEPLTLPSEKGLGLGGKDCKTHTSQWSRHVWCKPYTTWLWNTHITVVTACMVQALHNLTVKYTHHSDHNMHRGSPTQPGCQHYRLGSIWGSGTLGSSYFWSNSSTSFSCSMGESGILGAMCKSGYFSGCSCSSFSTTLTWCRCFMSSGVR